MASSSGDDLHLSEMGIILLGYRTAKGGKSKSGNTLLGSEQFSSGETDQCEKRQGDVAGRRLTVVNTPGWWAVQPLNRTSELIKQQIVLSASLCPPGPHALLLVIPAGESLTADWCKNIEDHMQLFGPTVWSHTMILFTDVNLGGKSIEHYIESAGEALKRLVDKCGNRYHVLNNKNRGDGTQVTELLQKIEEMGGDKGGCFEIDRAVLEETEKKMRTQDEGATRRQMKVKKERESIRSRMGDDLHLSEMGIILLGHKCSGSKSKSGNTLLGSEQFTVDPSERADQCEKRQGDVAGRRLTVVNTPGWYGVHSLTETSELIKQQIVLSESLCPLGPHALLLVIPASGSLTADECKNIEDHVQLLGPTVWSHTMILFTNLKGKSIEHFIESEGEGLQRLVEKCGDRYHVLDNENRGDDTQVTELLMKVEEMVAGNGGRLYGTGSPATPTPDKLIKRPCVALYDYRPQEEGDLEFKKGDVIYIINKDDVNWWYGSLNGKEGLFPSNYMKELVELESSGEDKEPSDAAADKTVSVETPSETGSVSSWSPDKKVSDWLNRQPASSSGYETMSEVPTQADADVMDLSDISSEKEEEEEEEEEDHSDDCMNMMMKMMKINSGEEELKRPDLDDYDTDQLYFRPCCEKCQHVQQSNGNKKIIPEKLSRGRLQAHLEGEGTYECALTGLIFDASEGVLVRYSILSWSMFNKFIQDPWRIAGPIFNVQTVDKDPSAVKLIQLPHSLCLAGQEKEKVFGVLHIKGKDPVIERVQSSGSHLKWPVSSLSPVGAIVLDTAQEKHHGAVLLYEDLWSPIDAHTFRIFPTSCNASHIKDIKKMTRGRFSKIDKNLLCLLAEENYHLMSEPRGAIYPEYLPFTLKPIYIRGFFEAYYEQPPPFTFHLKMSGTDETAWTDMIRQGDLVGSKAKRPSILQRLSHFPRGASKKETVTKQRTDASDKGPSSWRRSLQPGASATQQHPIDGEAAKLKSVREQFIVGISEPTLHSLLDRLLTKDVISDDEMEAAMGKSLRADKARYVIDTVRRKGNKASSEMIDMIDQLDHILSEELQLKTPPTV